MIPVLDNTLDIDKRAEAGVYLRIPSISSEWNRRRHAKSA